MTPVDLSQPSRMTAGCAALLIVGAATLVGGMAQRRRVPRPVVTRSVFHRALLGSPSGHDVVWPFKGSSGGDTPTQAWSATGWRQRYGMAASRVAGMPR